MEFNCKRLKECEFNLTNKLEYRTQFYEDYCDNLLSETRNGLLIDFSSGSTTNPILAIIRGVSGFWVEDGQICYPVGEIQ